MDDGSGSAGLTDNAHSPIARDSDLGVGHIACGASQATELSLQ